MMVSSLNFNLLKGSFLAVMESVDTADTVTIQEASALPVCQRSARCCTLSQRWGWPAAPGDQLSGVSASGQSGVSKMRPGQ